MPTEAPEWDVEPTEESFEEESDSPIDYEIMNYPADLTLGGYVDLYDRKEISIPNFQRQYVWDRVRASKLVESFLLGLPVPGTFLYKERTKPGYLVIDGQQRIMSLIKFIQGSFEDKTFRLKNVQKKFEGKSFQDLTEEEKFRFKGLTLRATIIQQINPNDDTSIYHIFERLNTGGVNLNPMEVRQCISYGPLVDALKKMNEDTNWRNLIGMPKVDKRLRDVELVLRCIALAEDWESYEKPMKGFLNKYMERRRKAPESYDELIDNFRRSVAFLYEALGERPFHLRGRLNYGALDSVMVCTLMDVAPSDIKKRFEKLKANPAYNSAITYNTSDESAIDTRLSTAIEFLAS
ncbi:DUF262 domain-containing protein [Sphingomonas hankookensis]